MESITHLLWYCKIFPHVYVPLSKVFGLDTSTWRLGTLEPKKTVDSLLLWTTRKADCWTCCKAHFFCTPTLHTLLCMWIDNITTLLRWEPLQHLAEPLMQLRHYVQEYDETVVLLAPTLSWWAQRVPQSPPRKKKKQMEHLEAAECILVRICTMEATGWITSYTDGSAKIDLATGLIGGYGVCVPATGLESSSFLPLNGPQANNRGKLHAAIELVQLCPHSVEKLLAAMNSASVQGPAYKWKAGHWCNQKGPVPNADLWESLLHALDVCHAQVQWISVPSHVDVPSNERTNELAEIGREQSPLATADTPAT